MLWLKMAAQEGHRAAIAELGRARGAFQQRILWLQEAAQNGCEPAIVELALVD
jgi:hypothetical protein